jgi:NADPH:quinone reductase
MLSGMKAIVFERHGGPDVLKLQDVPDPTPGDGQVLVDVEAVGINYRDVYERDGSGYGSPPPAVIGVEGAGRIVDTGEHVAWTAVPGSYAERIAATRDQLVPVPDGLSSEMAAASLLQGMTAHYLAYDSYPIRQGDWVVVHAGAGGVGLLLTQLAKLRGGNVLATTSTDEKAALAREAGADHVTGYDDFVERVRELTNGEGAAAIYDGVGKRTFQQGLDALRPFGYMILYGAASGQPDPLVVATLAPKGSLYVQRPTLMTYTRMPQLLRERASQIFDLVAAGKLQVRIGHRYPLAEAERAHADLEARKTTGKLLLLPR